MNYAGFWVRLGATLIDTLLIIAVYCIMIYAAYGPEAFPEVFEEDRPSRGSVDDYGDLFNIFWILSFWYFFQATPGKIAVKTKIVDAKTGGEPHMGQYIGRYFAYILSAIPFGLGFLWIAWDSRKQGWHDKLSGTVVIQSIEGNPAADFI